MSITIVSEKVPSNGLSLLEGKKLFLENSVKKNYDRNTIHKGLLGFDVFYNNKNYSRLDEYFGSSDRLTWFYTKDDEVLKTSDTQFEVEEALYSLNFTLNDFNKGICSSNEEGDNRTFKVGKILGRNPEFSNLIQRFNNCPERQATKKKYCVTLSRNPYDILTMSTFRGWRSCMAVDSSNFNYVLTDLSVGTLIVYIHSEDDMNLEHPSGRILLKPFYTFSENNLVSFYKKEGDSYVTFPREVETIIEEIEMGINNCLLKNNPVISGSTIPNIYRDSLSSNHTIINMKLINEDSVKDIDLSNTNSDQKEKIANKLSYHDNLIYNLELLYYMDINKIKSITDTIKELSNLPKSNKEKFLSCNLTQKYGYEFILNLLNEYNLIEFLPSKELTNFIEYDVENNYKDILSKNPFSRFVYLEDDLFENLEDYILARKVGIEINFSNDKMDPINEKLFKLFLEKDQKFPDALAFLVHNKIKDSDYKNFYKDVKNIKSMLVTYDGLKRNDDESGMEYMSKKIKEILTSNISVGIIGERYWSLLQTSFGINKVDFMIIGDDIISL